MYIRTLHRPVTGIGINLYLHVHVSEYMFLNER